MSRDRHSKILLPPADGAEIEDLPVQTCQLEQTLRHAHRLAQRQIEQALDGQAELKRRFAILPAAPAFAAGLSVPAHILVQPDQQRTPCIQRRVVLVPVGRSILWFGRCTHADNLPEPRFRGC